MPAASTAVTANGCLTEKQPTDPDLESLALGAGTTERNEIDVWHPQTAVRKLVGCGIPALLSTGAGRATQGPCTRSRASGARPIWTGGDRDVSDLAHDRDQGRT
jgi:hypothetical protein